MNSITRIIILLAASLTTALGQGFTDSYVTFYGEVRQVGGAGTTLLQSGILEVTFANQAKTANRVTLETALRPTGTGTTKPYSYALKVPLAYLPEAPRLGEFLAIGAQETDFRIESITIDGAPATLPDGSVEFYGLSFASRAEQYRLDLLVTGDSTDSDGDGLPDWWERLHGLDPNLADANADPDGDGWNNLREFQLGSNPQESNLEPTLATAELLVPELGQAGSYLQFHDSDTPPPGLLVTVDPSTEPGFEWRLDGSALPPATDLSLAAIQSGRLTVAHRDPAIRSASLPLTWSDGGDEKAGSILIRVTSPSTSDGNDAALWLDAATLPLGEPLATWNDRSGNGRNAMQPLEENRPAVMTFGRHHTVRFAQPTSHLFFQNEAIPPGNHTILAAWRSGGSRTGAQVVFSSNRGFLRLDPTAEAVSYPGAPLYQADGLAVRGYEATLGSTSTSIFRREGSTVQNIFGLSYNGEAIPPETIDPVLPTLGAKRLALPVTDPITNGFEGDLHELLIFPTALGEQKLRDVHDYLQSKWSGYVCWDFSTDLRPVTLTAAGSGRHIIRGGHASDDLRGGDASNILSGGPGNDLLRGSAGDDTFVFGGVDTGRDIIIDFAAGDVIDLSALFWGRSGDARQFLTTRLDTNFSTPVPTLDTVLIVQRPDAAPQEIVLRDTVLGPQQIIELIVEGRIRMGGLSIPTEVALALAPGSEDTTILRESLEDSFTVEVSRSGEGVAGALDVPLGLFHDALGRDLLLEGSTHGDGQRAVVRFERGETVKQITFRPVPDLETEGTERWETAVLPHFRYGVSGNPVARSVSDDPAVRIAVIEANALTSGQAARVRVIREGSTTSPLTVALELDGTALEGVHINGIPRSLTIPAGQAAAEITVTTAPGWDGAMTRLAMLRLVARDGYLVGSPHEATLYAAATASDADGAGFDRWLTAATAGDFSNLLELLQSDDAGRLGDYLRAYAFGRPSPDTTTGDGISFRLVDDRPELTARLAAHAADLRWQVQSTSDAGEWRDVSPTFTQHLSTEGLTLLGSPREAGQGKQLYRLAFDLQGGSNLPAELSRLANSNRYGMTGRASWQADPATGQLSSSSPIPGTVSRLIVEVSVPTLLDFEMSVRDGDESDLLRLFIAGALVAETGGEAVQVRRKLDPTQPVTLMWEVHHGTGTAMIGPPPSDDPPGDGEEPAPRD